MTDAELWIIEFLISSDATRPADLPDWLLTLLDRDRQNEPSHELITAASLMYIRRLHPAMSFGTAPALIAEYAADRARLEDSSGRNTAFRLSCCFERLKRSGVSRTSSSTTRSTLRAPCPSSSPRRNGGPSRNPLMIFCAAKFKSNWH
jgi:hypothetical protein